MKITLLLLSLVLAACGKDPGSATAQGGTGTALVTPLGPAPSPTPSSPAGPVYSQQYEVTWTVSVATGAIDNYTTETLTAPRQYAMPAMNQIVDNTFVQPSEQVRVTLILGAAVRCTYTKAFGNQPYVYSSGQCPTPGTAIDLPIGATVSFELFDTGNTTTRTVSAHTTFLE